MRINQLQIRSFGKWNEKRLRTDAPMICFYGENEAGKSTLMQFVRYMLYGFPNRTRKDTILANGSGQGGMLELWVEQGQQALRVERWRQGKEQARLITSDGTIRSISALQPLMGNMSADMYNKIFAFGLSELQTIQSLHSDEISSYLYTVGTGVSHLAEAEKRLQKDMDKIFKPKGRNQEIYSVLRALSETEQQISRHKSQLEQYAQLRLALQELSEQIEVHVRQREKVKAEKEAAELSVKVFDSWLRCRQVEEELAALTDFSEFPDDAEERLKAADGECKRLELAQKKLIHKQKDTKQRLDELPVGEARFNSQQRRELEQLWQDLSAYCEQVEQTRHLSSEIEVRRAELGEGLSRLQGTGIETLEQLQDKPLTLQDQAWVTKQREHQQEWLQTKSQLQQQKQELLEQQELEELQQQAQVGELRSDPLLEKKSRRSSSSLRFKYMDSIKWLLPALLLIATVISAALNQHQAWTMLCGVLAISLFILLQQRAKTDAARQSWRQKLEDELSQYQQQQAAHIQDRASRLQLQLKQVERKLETVQDEQQVGLDEWRKWLADKGLARSLTPDMAADVLASVQRLKLACAEWAKQQYRYRQLEDKIVRFETRAVSLLGLKDAMGLEEQLQRSREAALSEETQRQERTRIARELQELDQQADELALERQHVQEQLQHLLDQTASSDIRELRQKLQTFGQWKELKREWREMRLTMAGLVEESQMEELAVRLTDTTKPELEANLADRQQKLDSHEIEMNKLLEDQGRLLEKQENLQTDRQLTALLQQLEEQKALLSGHAKRWAVAALGLELIRETKRVYEEEKQPAVLRQAARYFSTLTDGKYVKIRAPMGERILNVTDRHGAMWNTSQLSRGTAEQLYLSMRLALMKIYAEHACLPVLLDDIFVNFDQPRLVQAMHVLREYVFAESASAGQQVLMFTCHPHVREAVRTHIPQAQHIDLHH